MRGSHRITITTLLVFLVATFHAKSFAQLKESFGSGKGDLAYLSPQQLDSATFSNAWDASGNDDGAAFGYEKILVGLEVRGKELIALDIVKTETDYLIPIDEVFPVIGASYQVKEGTLTVRVPKFEVKIPVSDTYNIDGNIWMALETVNEYLKANGRFEPTKYALTFLPPWSDSTAAIGKAAAASDVDIDYKPDSFSLRQFRLSHEVLAEKDGGPVDFERESDRSELLSSGAALGGSWFINAEKTSSQKWRPDEYFWLNRDDQQQWLIGKQIVTPSVVAPTVELTGAQYFYSNQDIPYDPYQDISQSSFFRELGTSVQTIRGRAEAGAVAQLYVNNQLVGETFVGLDGTYDFGEVRAESGLYNEIEVVIVDAISRTEIERQDKTRLSSENLLNERQMITSVALGKKGNWLDPNYEEDGEAGMFLYRYGLSDETTVEAGYLLDDINTATVGIASSLGSNFVGAYRAAKRNDALTQQIELDGFGDDWRLTSFVREQEAKFFEGTEDGSTTANGYFYYMPAPSLRLEMIGRYEDRGDDVDKVNFIKPGVFYSPTSQFSIGLRPDNDGAYRTELYYRPSMDSRLRVTHKPEEQTIRFDHQVNDTVQSYFSGRMYKGTIADKTRENTIMEQAVGFYWQPSDWKRYDRLRLELNHSNEYGTGVFAEYRTQVAAGIYLDLRLREADPQFDGGFSAFARISMDFAVAGDKFIPATQRTSYNTDGTIAGTLITGNEQCDIENVSVVVNGINYKVPVSGCSFYLDKVTPGVHRVSLDGEFLPIELVPDSEVSVVQVAPSSVTRVDFDVRAEYSGAGQVKYQNGKAVSNVSIHLLDAEGELIMQTEADQFGYYRVDGLVNGDYQVRVVAADNSVMALKSFSIQGDFIFGLDLVIPNEVTD